jgi:hypothetical protein
MTPIETTKWKFQYGPWDLRIDCPNCPRWEAFFRTLLDVDHENVVADLHCRDCNWWGSVKLVGASLPDRVCNSVVRDLTLGGPYGSKPEVYDKAKEVMGAAGIAYPASGSVKSFLGPTK